MKLGLAAAAILLAAALLIPGSEDDRILQARQVLQSVGITVPAVTVVEDPDLGSAGKYGNGVVTVRDLDNTETLVHEMVHAWDDAYMKEAQRRTWLEIRGLTEWTSGDYIRRGSEDLAITFEWALFGEPLVAEDNEDLERWATRNEAFRFITGMDAPRYAALKGSA